MALPSHYTSLVSEVCANCKHSNKEPNSTYCMFHSSPVYCMGRCEDFQPRTSPVVSSFPLHHNEFLQREYLTRSGNKAILAGLDTRVPKYSKRYCGWVITPDSIVSVQHWYSCGKVYSSASILDEDDIVGYWVPEGNE